MVFEKIEQLKTQFTDKYVVVDEGRPELRRFGGMTGMVKTVNMSGRALVQFDADNNIGWYDIDLGYLKVVDAPPPKVEAKEAKKAAPKAEGPATPAAHEKPVGEKPAAAKAAAAKPAAGGKSVADILAAARGAKPAGTTEASKAEAKPAPASGDKPKQSTAEILAAARSKAPAPAAAKTETAPVKPAAAKPAAEGAKVDPKKMSVAEILAAARGKAGAPPAAAPAKKEPAAKAAPVPVEEAAQEEEPAAEEPVVDAAKPASAAAASGDGKKSKQGHFKTVAEIVAYCRQIDAKK